MIGRLALLACSAFLVAFTVSPGSFAVLFEPLATHDAPAIYTQTSLLRLTLSHLLLVGASVAASVILAVGLGILVTRPAGHEFLPLARMVTAVGQTFPPVAVLALMVPIMGFGAAPTFVALFVYGLLPVFENTLTGLTTLPPSIIEAARGAGMTRFQRLIQIEMPLALPVILAGIRLTAVISLATATLGSTVAAKTLGEVIIAGLLSSNTAFVVQGGLVVGLLAIIIYEGFQALETRALRRTGLLRPELSAPGQ